jgi:flagellar export protein FliJ
MKAFVFRAQAALDLRRRQDEDAQRALAHAEGLRQLAKEALDRAEASLEDACRQAREVEGCDAEMHARIWYRNWIALHKQRVAGCRDEHEARRRAAEDARARARIARRQLQTLERFRDRAWRDYVQAERRMEQKALDDLGTVRFTVARIQAGGRS